MAEAADRALGRMYWGVRRPEGGGEAWQWRYGHTRPGPQQALGIGDILVRVYALGSCIRMRSAAVITAENYAYSTDN